MHEFLYKVKAAIARFMIGRHGTDQFSLALLFAAIVLNILSVIPHLGFLSILAMAALFYSIFRIYSRNNTKRYQENGWFLQRFGSIPVKLRQAWIRLKNRRKYLYFDCPQCHAKLRLPRGVGNVTITCGQCGNIIHKKA